MLICLTRFRLDNIVLNFFVTLDSVVRLQIRPVTSLGHQDGRRVFSEGPKFFELCPIVKTMSNTFFQGGENFSRGALHQWLRACCRLLYWKVWFSGVSQICRDCLLYFRFSNL